MAPIAPLWRDPLFSPGDRFPLGPPEGNPADRYEDPSGPESRPFSLRGVVAGGLIDAPCEVTFRYCPERQITMVTDADGREIELAKHTTPGATAPDTTGHDSAPGQAPPEETTGVPDYQSD